jgi:hypothetical protein
VAGFEEVMRRRVSQQQGQAAAAQQRIAIERAAAERAVSVMVQSLADMARYLGQQGARTYTQTYVAKPRAFLPSKNTSPPGYVLHAGRPVKSLQLLTTDGRLWRFHNFRATRSDSVIAEYISITADAILNEQVFLGEDAVRLNNGELALYNDGFYTPYFDGLTALTQRILEPSSFAWLWQ